MDTRGKDSDRWQDAARFFKGEMAEYGWDFSPYINLVERVAKSDYADDLFPLASRWGGLSFSLTNDFEASLKMPVVSVACKLNGFGRAEYQVEYWSRPGSTHDLLKWRCHKSQVWPLLESLFLRMKMEHEAEHAT